MATNHVAGQIDSVDHVAASDITSGDVVEMADVTGVALGTVPTGDSVAVAVTGTFSLPKGAITLAQGAAVDWDGSEVIATAGSKIGYVRAAAASGDATVDVTLER